MRQILMLAGEPSGDLHGSSLATELKKLSPEIELSGTGGEGMKAAGVKLLFDLKDLAVTGLIDVIKKYFHFKKIQKTLLSYIQYPPLPSGEPTQLPPLPSGEPTQLLPLPSGEPTQLPPLPSGERAGVRGKVDLIILIDYPDFNLRFAKLAHSYGVPIIYYISPQVWAWRKGRIRLIKRYVKKVYCIFKFEEELYKEAGVPVEFIGHPLLDIVKPEVGGRRSEDRRDFPVPPTCKTIALLPGSRKRLIKTLLPIMLEAAEIIHKRFPQARFIISKVPSVDKKIYADAAAVIARRPAFPVIARRFLARHCEGLTSFDVNPEAISVTGSEQAPQSLFTIVEGAAYDIINAADLVLTVSGTSTLETAILGRPMVIIYKLPLLEYMLAKPLLRLRHIGLVNIVAGEEVVPECVQLKASPKKIAGLACDILTDENKYNSIKSKLSDVVLRLYPNGAAKKAAASILIDKPRGGVLLYK